MSPVTCAHAQTFSYAKALMFSGPGVEPQNTDLGNIASDGSGGRQPIVRPLEAADVGHLWTFFPPHFQLPDIYSAPTPATPAQSDVVLRAGMPLVLVLPELQHFPESANV
ncbi:MAG TPA: hypothetical protein VHE81_17360, partial [Lacipirellulaceae bacterium]|nr:hypothetical protein [Lacipirellulaceae bacterium]